MSADSSSHGLLFPSAPALASWGGQGDLEIVDFGAGLAVRAEGRFAAEARGLLQGGVRGPGLGALAPGHPIHEALARLIDQPHLPLSPATALRLDRFDTLFLELTGACTSRCIHCYARADEGVSTRLDRQTARAVIDDAVKLGFRWIQLTGGEPLLCDFLEELVEHANRSGVPTCEIYTNGMLLDDRRLQGLAGLGPCLAFSFYSHRKEVHEAITRTEGSFELTSSAIRRVADLGLPLRVSIVVMPENADHVAETIDYITSLGARNVSYGRAYAVGRGNLYSGEIRAPKDQAGAGYCREHHGKLCVSHDGTVHPCIFNRTIALGRVPEQSLEAIAEAPLVTCPTELARQEFLEECGRTLSCPECRLTAYALRILQEG